MQNITTNLFKFIQFISKQWMGFELGIFWNYYSNKSATKNKKMTHI